MFDRIIKRLPLLLSMTVLMACDEAENRIPTATFTSISNSVFSTSCISSNCHSSEAKAGDLSLEGSKSYLNLIRVNSNLNSEKQLVSPFSPEESYLITVLDNATIAESSDPHSKLNIDEAVVNRIKMWIEQGAVVPHLASIQSQVFSNVCVVCHSTPNPAGGLNLQDGESYSSLVNTKRMFDPEIRVISNDADNSFLINKLEGTDLGGSRGSQMPLNQKPLPKEIINTIREWINNGALEDDG